MSFVWKNRFEIKLKGNPKPKALSRRKYVIRNLKQIQAEQQEARFYDACKIKWNSLPSSYLHVSRIRSFFSKIIIAERTSRNTLTNSHHSRFPVWGETKQPSSVFLTIRFSTAPKTLVLDNIFKITDFAFAFLTGSLQLENNESFIVGCCCCFILGAIIGAPIDYGFCLYTSGTIRETRRPDFGMAVLSIRPAVCQGPYRPTSVLPWSASQDIWKYK